jgi:hypothetical protein
MKTSIKLLLGTTGILLLSTLRGKAEDETANETETGIDTEASPQLAMTGFQVAAAYERELEDRQPVDISGFEDDAPACGRFYQARRGDTWLGEHERSITFRALYRTTFIVATEMGHEDPAALARSNASNPGLRKALFDLCVGQWWGDELYGTYFLSSKTPVGPHGRSIPLVRFCAENRQRLIEGEAAMRIAPRGCPQDRGLGTPSRKVLHDTQLGNLRLALPFLWLPVLNPEKLMEGIVTTRGMVWGDGTSGLEPPPQVAQLKVAVLS